MTTTLSTKILQALESQGIPSVVSELNDLEAKADTDWKKSLLRLAIDLMATQGVSGINTLRTLASNIDSDEPDLSLLSFGEASDILALLQRQEADNRKHLKEFLNSLLTTLLRVTEILVTTLAKEI